MATTTNIKQIDEALRRPGRMDRVFSLQQLTQVEREKILYKAAKETMDAELMDWVDWRKVNCDILIIIFLCGLDDGMIFSIYAVQISH